MQRWPFALKMMLALGIFLFIDSWLVPGNIAVNILGSSVRFDGFLVQAGWYVLAIVTAGLVYARGGDVEQPLRFLIVGAVLSALWALAQAYGFEPVSLLYSEPLTYNEDRVAYGPMALTGLTAAHLAVVLTAFVALQKRFRVLPALVVMVLAAALIATGNRTAPAALMLTVGGLALSYLVRRRYWHVGVISLYAIVALGALVLVQTTRSVPIEQLERTTQLVRGSDTSFQTRLVFWTAGIRGMFDYPLTGLGPNGFNQIFWQHLSREEKLPIIKHDLPDGAKDIMLSPRTLLSYRLPEQTDEDRPILATITMDKAHNYLLDMIIASGWPSAILFLSAIGSGVAMMLRSGRREARAVALATCVYVLFGLTWFATLQVDPIVWGLFGVGIGAVWARPDHTASLSNPPVK
ncbi:MAG: O-antigen ligase family protein [Trueperaceae bacterium]|nr:O-antigen ligase family protein [Trueperaceae bacterium]